ERRGQRDHECRVRGGSRGGAPGRGLRGWGRSSCQHRSWPGGRPRARAAPSLRGRNRGRPRRGGARLRRPRDARRLQRCGSPGPGGAVGRGGDAPRGRGRPCARGAWGGRDRGHGRRVRGERAEGPQERGVEGGPRRPAARGEGL
ncbi:MAG: hypothetical protein AVDCRST_MAG05-1597, partial [uncultured Rubrobacteraceae bacterium]